MRDRATRPYVRNDPVNFGDPSGMFIAPLLRNLFNNFSALSTGGFGFDWNETDFLYRQIGTAPLYHSDDPDFPFENYTSEQLQSLAGDHVIDYLGQAPVYASTLMDFSNDGTGGPQPDKLTSKREVMKAMYCLWKSGGYGNQRTERSMWITQDSQGQYGFKPWPWSATWGRKRGRGPYLREPSPTPTRIQVPWTRNRPQQEATRGVEIKEPPMQSIFRYTL